MPLNPMTLGNEIENNIMQKAADGGDVTADDWCDCLVAYISEATNPPGGGTTTSVARASFKSTYGDGSMLKLAILQFGMAVTPGAIGSGGPAIPPSIPPMIEVVFPLGMANAPISTIATTMASAIHATFMSGIYISGTPVSPVPFPWT